MMPKAKLTYWQKRFLQIAIDRDKEDAKYIAEMQKRQRALSKSLRNELNYWLDRYATNEGITREEAQMMLSKQEQKNWTMSLEEYRRKAIAGGYEQELNKEYFTSRITRIEQLQRQLYFEFADAANKETKEMSEYLKSTLDATHLRHIYELGDRGKISVGYQRYSKRALEVAVNKPWKGSNFSKRVWGNHTRLMPDRLTKTMSAAIVNGWGINRTVDEMMQHVDKTLRHRMTTLVQTESAHLAEVASQRAMKETGVERWEWLATLETHTCEVCASYDGKEFDIDDANAPTCPSHPNCRCTTIPVIDGWKSSARWQRDPITGEGSVGEDMTFEDWRKKQEAPIKENKRSFNESISSKLTDKQSEFYQSLLVGANKDALAMWDKYNAELTLGSTTESGAHYSPLERRVNMNIEEDIRGSWFAKPGNTFYHEFGHNIDHLANNNDGAITADFRLSNGKTLGETVYSDVQKRVKAIAKEKKLKPLYARDDIKKQLASLQEKDGTIVSSISDLYGGATNNQAKSRVGHRSSYWKMNTLQKRYMKMTNAQYRDTRLGVEAFAEFTAAALTDEDELNLLKEWLPETYDMYFELIREITRR